MASIPLPALGIKPPEQPDMFGNLSKALSVRDMIQQHQMGQVQLDQAQLGQQEQQTIMQSLAQHKGDPDAALADLQGKVRPQTLLGMQESFLKLAQTKATLHKDELDNNIKVNDATLGLIDQAKSLSPEAYLAAWPQIAATALKIHPEYKDHIDPNTPIPQQALDQIAIGAMTDNQFNARAKAKQEAAAAERAQKESDATLPGKVAESEIKQAEAKSLKNGGLTQQLADTRYRQVQEQLASGNEITAGDKAFVKAYEKQKLLVPTASANIRVEGMMNAREYPVFDKKSGSTIMATPEEINRASRDEPGRYTAPSYTPEAVGAKDTTAYFTKGKGGQQLTAFNTAITHLDTLDRLGADLQNTDIRVVNKAKQEFAKQTGGAAPANFDAAKNAMSGEVAAALKASGATDQEIGKVSETFDKAQSPAQLKGSINTYRELLKSKEVQLKKQYDAGMQGKPAFEQSQAQDAAPLEITLPSGKKISIK